MKMFNVTVVSEHCPGKHGPDLSQGGCAHDGLRQLSGSRLPGRLYGKSFLLVIMVAGLVTAQSVIGQAAPIAWVGPTGITGDTNLLTNGTYLDALIPDTGATALTVDGETFNAASSQGGNAYGDGVITFTGNGLHDYGYAGSFPLNGNASMDFATLMDDGGVFQFGGNGSGTVTISGLTVGASYQVQVFNYAPGIGDLGLTTLSGSPPVTLAVRVFDGGTNTYSQFATGTFTAEAGTESFEWKGAGSSSTVLGSISVRKLPPLVLSAAVTGGQFTLQFTGTKGQSYIVERSTNLAVGNWTPVYTNSPNGGVFIFTTGNLTNASSFFRVSQ